MDFSLRERLEQAANERRIAAGLPPSRRPTLVEPTEVAPPEHPAELPLPDAERELSDFMIDLRDTSSVFAYAEQPRNTLSEPAAPAESVFNTSPAAVGLTSWNAEPQLERITSTTRRNSRPSTATREKCPACLAPTQLELFDLAHAVAHLKCIECGLEFTHKRPRL